MLLLGDILGLGHSQSALGETVALAITFLGIGVIANLLIAYTVAQVMAEKRANMERVDGIQQSRRI